MCYPKNKSQPGGFDSFRIKPENLQYNRFLCDVAVCPRFADAGVLSLVYVVGLALCLLLGTHLGPKVFQRYPELEPEIIRTRSLEMTWYGKIDRMERWHQVRHKSIDVATSILGSNCRTLNVCCLPVIAFCMARTRPEYHHAKRGAICICGTSLPFLKASFVPRSTRKCRFNFASQAAVKRLLLYDSGTRVKLSLP